jgi:hypothetical protein
MTCKCPSGSHSKRRRRRRDPRGSTRPTSLRSRGWHRVSVAASNFRSASLSQRGWVWDGRFREGERPIPRQRRRLYRRMRAIVSSDCGKERRPSRPRRCPQCLAARATIARRPPQELRPEQRSIRSAPTRDRLALHRSIAASQVIETLWIAMAMEWRASRIWGVRVGRLRVPTMRPTPTTWPPRPPQP